MKAIINIQDETTNEYYSVPKINGPMDLGYPCWTKDIKQAHDFGSITSAHLAMNKEDFAEGGLRNPVIVAN